MFKLKIFTHEVSMTGKNLMKYNRSRVICCCCLLFHQCPFLKIESGNISRNEWNILFRFCMHNLLISSLSVIDEIS